MLSPTSRNDERRQRVNLVKTDGTLGGVPVGTQFEVLLSPDLPRAEAKIRAYRLLKRDYPFENSMCWTADGDA